MNMGMNMNKSYDINNSRNSHLTQSNITTGSQGYYLTNYLTTQLQRNDRTTHSKNSTNSHYKSKSKSNDSNNKNNNININNINNIQNYCQNIKKNQKNEKNECNFFSILHYANNKTMKYNKKEFLERNKPNSNISNWKFLKNSTSKIVREFFSLEEKHQKKIKNRSPDKVETDVSFFFLFFLFSL